MTTPEEIEAILVRFHSRAHGPTVTMHGSRVTTAALAKAQAGKLNWPDWLAAPNRKCVTVIAPCQTTLL